MTANRERYSLTVGGGNSYLSRALSSCVGADTAAKPFIFNVSKAFSAFLSGASDMVFGSLSNRDARYLSTSAAAVIADDSAEGRALSDDTFQAIHSWLDRYGIEPYQLVYASTNLAAPAQYRSWADKVGWDTSNSRIRFFFAHRFAHDFIDAVSLRESELITRPLCMSPPERIILCVNNAPRLHRCILVRALQVFAPAQHYASLSRGKWASRKFDLKSLERQCRNRLTTLAKVDGGELLEPLLQDFTIEGLFENLTLPSINEARPMDAISDLHARTVLSVVNESQMSDTILGFTEKTLKPILNGTPFLMAGNRGVLQALEKFGFEVNFNHIEQIPDHAEFADRMCALLREIRRLAGYDIGEAVSIRDRNEAKLYHNRAHLVGGFLARYKRMLSLQFERIMDGISGFEDIDDLMS